jgi:hypothetical protein
VLSEWLVENLLVVLVVEKRILLETSSVVIAGRSSVEVFVGTTQTSGLGRLHFISKKYPVFEATVKV